MGFFKNLCCGSEEPPFDSAPRPAVSSGDRPGVNEKCDSNPEAAKLPTKPSNFIAHLNHDENTRTGDLLQHYLEYELWLRRAFAQGSSNIDGEVNLVPIFGEKQRQLWMRNLDRRTSDSEGYLMRLPDKNVREEGAPATAESLDDFKNNFDAFTHGTLKNLGIYTHFLFRARKG